MNKQEFITQLRKWLSGLPQADVEEHLTFYSEMIEDRIEDGMSESEAVSEMGSVDAVAAKILSETLLTKPVNERIKPKRVMNVWEIVLIVLGAPIWLSLLVALLAIFIAVYIVIWSVVVALWSICASFAACSLGGIVSSVAFIFQGNRLTGLAMLGIGICCAGLAIFLFFGCKAVTKGIVMLTQKTILGVKALFVGKEAS